MIQYFAEALDVLLANRARSFLTALGLIIGVMAVIAIQILGSGMAGAVSGVLGSINDRSFTLIPNPRQNDFTRALIKPADIDRAKRTIPGIAEAIPAAGLTRLARIGHRDARLSVAGESDERFITTPIRYGRTFSQDDVATSQHVALLADEGYARLFPAGGDPTGESLRIGDRRYVIVGVLEKPKTGIIPNIVRADVLLPYTTYREDFLQGKTVFGARFLVKDGVDLPQTEAATIAFFRDIKKGRVEYQTFDRKSFSSAVDGIFGGLTLVVALIGAVSLLVAGIGILNIMLVSVAERTREIGLRKALGATRRNIMTQFLLEGMFLTGVSGAIGIAAAGLLMYVLNAALGTSLPGFDAPRLVPWSAALAFGALCVSGIVAGVYPAGQAAKLDPVEALRRE